MVWTQEYQLMFVKVDRPVVVTDVLTALAAVIIWDEWLLGSRLYLVRYVMGGLLCKVGVLW